MKKNTNKKMANLSVRKNSSYVKFNNFTLHPSSQASMSVFQSGHKRNCEPGWYTKPTCYDHYIIHYILNGKGKYYPPQGIYELQKGNMFLIPPNQMISY